MAKSVRSKKKMAKSGIELGKPVLPLKNLYRPFVFLPQPQCSFQTWLRPSSAFSWCNLSDMVQTTALKTFKSIIFLLPDFLAAWPYKQRLHPDYGTVNVESTNWVNDYDFFNEKAQ